MIAANKGFLSRQIAEDGEGLRFLTQAKIAEKKDLIRWLHFFTPARNQGVIHGPCVAERPRAMFDNIGVVKMSVAGEPQGHRNFAVRWAEGDQHTRDNAGHLSRPTGLFSVGLGEKLGQHIRVLF